MRLAFFLGANSVRELETVRVTRVSLSDWLALVGKKPRV